MRCWSVGKSFRALNALVREALRRALLSRYRGKPFGACCIPSNARPTRGISRTDAPDFSSRWLVGRMQMCGTSASKRMFSGVMFASSLGRQPVSIITIQSNAPSRFNPFSSSGARTLERTQSSEKGRTFFKILSENHMLRNGFWRSSSPICSKYRR